MKLIKRTDLLDCLLGLRGTPDIKVVTGLRRSGKSVLLRSFVSVVKRSDPLANIVFIDLVDLENEPLKDYRTLYEYARDQVQEGCSNYLCIDEVQLCDGFELAINSLHAQGIYDIYITGSNAFLMSADLATLFTGRYIEVHVFPFSFAEYRTYFGEEEVDAQLDEYVRAGGLAGSYPYARQRDRDAYIRGVYETIVSRDLVQKYSVANPAALSGLSEFMMDNIGNLCSANSISEAMDGGVSHVTTGNYLQHLCNSFLFYKVKRYDIRGKRYLSTSDKYYLADLGIRWAVLGTRNMDYGRAYENLVALELMRRGWELYVGKLYEKEVDFVAIKGSEKAYVQVSDDISAPGTLDRELAPLKAVRDAYPKLLLARTRHDGYDNEGVQVIDLARWLAGDVAALE